MAENAPYFRMTQLSSVHDVYRLWMIAGRGPHPKADSPMFPAQPEQSQKMQEDCRAGEPPRF